MTPIKTGIVGLGYWGPNVLRNFAAQPECEMLWACDTKNDLLDRTRRHYPSLHITKHYEEMLKDDSLDLVLIATPTATHFPLAKQALEAGKHVFIEKPMTSSSKEARDLVKIAKEKDRKIFVDHTFVFAPAVERMGASVASGALGDLLYFDSVRINLGLIQRDANVLWDLAIHDLSILGTLVDWEGLASVAAHGSRHFGEQIEQAHLHLSFENGFTAHIHVSWLSPVKIRQTILGGSKAMILFDDTHPSEKLRIYDKGIDHDTTRPDPFFPKYRSGDIVIPALSNKETLATEAQHVLRCLQGGALPLVPGEDGARIVEILEAAQESLKKNSATISMQ